MIGIPVLAIIAAYVLLARFVTKRMPTRHWKWGAIAIFVLIPTGDTAVGYVYFRYLCATEAGNKIYRTAENVEGFYGNSGDVFFKYGYRYTEDRELDGSLRRYSIGHDGRIAMETVESLKSRFGTRRLTEPDFLETYKYRYEIYDLQTNEIYAIGQSVRYKGGWIATAPGRLIGLSGGWHYRCDGGHTESELLLNTLHVVK